MRVLRALSLCCASICLLGSPSLAAPDIDEDAGVWLDRYVDLLGLIPVDGVLTKNVVHDFFGQVVNLDDVTLPGQLTTLVIAPVSFSEWGTVSVDFAGSAAEPVTITAIDVDCDPTTGCTDRFPIPLGPSTDGFDRTGDLTAAGLTTATQRIQLEVVLNTGVIAPVLEGLQVTWAPRSRLGIVAEGGGTACTNDSATVIVNVSTSFVEAQDVVLYAEVPRTADGTLATTFARASDGGRLTVVDRTIDGVLIPAFSVYWVLGARPAGSSFKLSATFDIPAGATAGSVFVANATAAAANADPVSGPLPEIVAESSPDPFVNLNASPTYQIGEDFYVEAGSVTYTAGAGNFRVYRGRCGETYRQSVLAVDISEILAFGATITDLGGGELISSDQPVEGVPITAPAIVWRTGDLAIKGRVSGEFVVNFPPTGTEPTAPINAVATIASAEHVESDQGEKAVRVNLPNVPVGIFALGESIDGYGRVSSDNDLAQNTVSFRAASYGGQVSYLSHTRNGGATTITDSVMVQAVPQGTTFFAAYANDPSVVVHYATTTEGSVNAPPGINAQGDLDPTVWQPSAPSADEVTYVAFTTPRLVSEFFGDDSGPVGVTGTMTVTVDVPTDGTCKVSVVTGTGAFRFYGSIPFGQTDVTPWTTLWHTQDEPTTVLADTPHFDYLNVVGAPDPVTPGEAFSFIVTIPNRSNAGLTPDTASDVEVTLTLPVVDINGVPTSLPYTLLDTGGGTADNSGLPDTLTVRYPKLFPDEEHRVAVTFVAPRGVLAGTPMALSGRVTGQDDVCGEFSNADSDSVVVAGLPKLQLVKSADLRIVNAGSALTYALDVINTGDVPSTGTWVIDRIPPGTTLDAVAPFFAGQEVRFADLAQPAALSSEDPFTPASIVATMVAGVDGGDGWVRPPVGMTPNYVAIRADDPARVPAQVVTDVLHQARLRVIIPDAVIPGQQFYNSAAITSNELIQAIANRTVAVVSGLASLSLAMSCVEVVSADEPVPISIHYRNDSVNDSTGVEITVVVPTALVVNDPGTAVQDGNALTWSLGALAAEAEGTLDFTLGVAPTTVSGTPVGLLANGQIFTGNLGSQAETSCVVLVQNADLLMRKRVDVDEPRSGDVVTYSLVVSNEGPHDAFGVTLTDSLPADMTYVEGSTRVVTLGWDLAPEREPSQLGGQLCWGELCGDPAADNGLTLDGFPPGYLPGNSGDVLVSFQATVNEGVEPGTELENCVFATATTAEDPKFANEACVTVTTPKPNPKVVVDAPALVRPGAFFSVFVEYRNTKGEDSQDVAVIYEIPDGPTTEDGVVDVRFANVSGDLHASSVQCVPSQDDSCKPCVDNFDCASGICHESGAEKFCVTACNPVSDSCGAGFSCATVEAIGADFCLPDSGSCNCSPENEGMTRPCQRTSALGTCGGTETCAPDLGWVGCTAPEPPNTNGETFWLLSGTAGDQTPGFDPVDPTLGGWVALADRDLLTGPVTHVAAYVGELEAFEGSYRLQVDLIARAVDEAGTLPIAGTTWESCATIASYASPPSPEHDPNDNRDCDETDTPGIDIASISECSPGGALPGTTPGATVELTLTLRNSGTVPAYGAKLFPKLPAGVTLQSIVAGAIEVTTADGTPSALVDIDGLPLARTVAWTELGDGRVLLGSDQPGDDHYQRLALPPGTQAQLVLVVTVDDSVPNDAALTLGGVAETDYRFDHDTTPDAPEEIIVVNNPSSCSVRSYRPDVFITKDVATEGGPGALAEGGQNLIWTLGYGNAGRFEAPDVVLEEVLPAGTSFVVGSISGLFTDAVTIEYDDGSGAWNATPVGFTGDIDYTIRAFRVLFNDPLAAPSNLVFSQTSAIDFEADTLTGTLIVDRVLDAIHPVTNLATETACDPAACQYQGTSLTYCEFGFELDETGCCYVCREPETCADGTCETCSGGWESCLSCDDSPEASSGVIWSTFVSQDSRENACYGVASPWLSCIWNNPVETCHDQLPAADAWYTCWGHGPGECPDVPADSCEHREFSEAHSRVWTHFAFNYEKCVAELGEAEAYRCEGFIPPSDWTACGATHFVDGCPAADADTCEWNDYLTACESHRYYNVAGLSQWCERDFGDFGVCDGFTLPETCGACLKSAPASPGGDGQCAWEQRAWSCFNHLSREKLAYESCRDGGEWIGPPAEDPRDCDWLARTDQCTSLVAPVCEVGADLGCSYQLSWSILYTAATNQYEYWDACLATANDASECDALIDPAVFACNACPGSGGSKLDWEQFGQNIGGLEATLLGTFSQCVEAHGGEACAWLAPTGLLRNCTVDNPPAPAADGSPFTCERQGWEQACDKLHASAANTLSTCLQAYDPLSTQTCESLLQPSSCSGAANAVCASADSPDELLLAVDAAQASGWGATDSASHGEAATYVNCVKAIARAEGETPADLSRGLAACDALKPREGASACLETCYEAEPHLALTQAQLCGLYTSEQYQPRAWNQSPEIPARGCVGAYGALVAEFGSAVPEDLCEGLIFDRPCGQSAPSCHQGVATTPRIPSDPTATVLEWDQLAISDVQGPGQLSYDVIDEATGLVVPGYASVRPDETGRIDLAGVDPAEVQALRVSARFEGAVDTCVRVFPLPGQAAFAGQARGDYAAFYVYAGNTPSGFAFHPDTGLNQLPVSASFNKVGHASVSGHMISQTWTQLMVPTAQPASAWTLVDFAALPSTQEGEQAILGSVNAKGWVAGVVPGPTGTKTAIWWTDSPTSTDYQRVDLPDVSFNTWSDWLLDDGSIMTSYGTIVRRTNDTLPPTWGAMEPLPMPEGDFFFAGTVPNWQPRNGRALMIAFGSTGAHLGAWWRDEAGQWQVTLFDLPDGHNPNFWYFSSGISDEGTAANLDLISKKLAFFVQREPGHWETVVQQLPSHLYPAFHDMSANGRVTFLSAFAGGGATTYVAWADGRFELLPTARSAPWSGGQPDSYVTLYDYYGAPWPAIWLEDCETKGAPRLDAWTAVYTTDGNPELSFETNVDDVCQTELVNTATIATSGVEITDVNNRATAEVGVATADVAVSVSAPGAALLGDEVAIDVTVTNAGPEIARMVTLTVRLPDGSESAHDLGDLPASGAPVTLNFTATIPSDELLIGTTRYASAEVDTATIACGPADDTASAGIAIGGFPNLAVAIDAPEGGITGEPVPVDVTIVNNGNDSMPEGATLTVNLPEGFALADAGGGTPGGGLLTWTYATELLPGDTRQETFILTAPGCDALGDAQLVATVTSLGTVPESSTADNTAADSTTVRPPDARLVLTSEVSRGDAQPGDPVFVTVHYANDGSEAADNAVIRIPTAELGVIADSLASNVTLEGSELVHRPGLLEPGERHSFGFAVYAASEGTTALAGSVSAEADGACPVAAVLPEVPLSVPGLHLVKSASTKQACATSGEQVVWSLLVTNDGPTAIDGVVVTDTVSDGLSYVADSIGGAGAMDDSVPVLVWNIPTLGPGEGLTLNYTTTAPAAAGLLLGGAAAATAINGEPVDSNTALVWGECEGRLVLTKAWDAGCALSGAPATMSLSWENRTGRDLDAVQLHDRLPEGLTLAGGGWTVDLDLGALAAGEGGAKVFELEGLGAPGDLLINVAQIAADGFTEVSNQVQGVVLGCDDGNVCTTNACSPAVGCVYPDAPPMTKCDDSNACTLSDLCEGSTCVGYNPVECVAKDQCHVPGICNPETGICTDPNADDGTNCERDGDPCSVEAECQAGSCEIVVEKDCNDDNVCTDDSCDSDVVDGCVNTANTDPCDDENACTTVDVCDAKACVGSVPPDCADTNDCTIDDCDPATGCTNFNAVDDTPCPNGDLCDGSETCQGGVCTDAPPPDCDDQDACTIDSCDPIEGCINADICDCAGCTYTKGYWKNHPDDWPVTLLTVGGQRLDQDELSEVMAHPPAGDASYILGSQYVAALLNQANGANDCSVFDALAEAEALLISYPLGSRPSGTDKAPMMAVAGEIRDWNEGATGPGHCDGNSEPPVELCGDGAEARCDDGNACTIDSCDPAIGCVNQPIPDCTTEDQGCTLTQGYWKNHPQDWPVTSLYLGSTLYSQAQLLDIFDTVPAGDASYQLAHQLIAAQLNREAGAGVPASVSAALMDSDAWFTSRALGSKPSGQDKQAAVSLAAVLDSYNNGNAGPPHCH